MSNFKLEAPFQPTGDQPAAIKQLVAGVRSGERHQTLLGVTGSGKTFTGANIIATLDQPTLVIAHNKTLAAQLAQEYRDFFPHNAVHYFVSYYDYYQPEAYLAASDTYIEKDAQINEEIERLRHASTQALLTRRDVIIVASVSCIYGLGSPAEYEKEHLLLRVGDVADRQTLLRQLIAIYYERTNADLVKGGLFRAIGNSIEIVPPGATEIYNLQLDEGKISRLERIDPVSRVIIDQPEHVFLFPAKHFVTSKDKLNRALVTIREEMNESVAKFEAEGKLLEADRLRRRTNYDLAMLAEVGYCNGVENYSRHLSGRGAGEPPETLLSYFPKDKNGRPDFLTIIDESHVTIPQIAGMFAGDASRKKNLIEHGFRLPSALDNRPLRFEEFEDRIGATIYTSATPGAYELEQSTKIVEQIIRPTGLIDPELSVRPIKAGNTYPGQIKDFISEAEKEIAAGRRVIATTLTKKMAEDLASYLKEQGIKTEYLHSEIKTLERIKILTDFRKGATSGGFDCLVGVNLLREGLDLPELGFIGILDADKEGFLRSKTSLIQTIGRAARNIRGRVIFYADQVTGSMQEAINETERRRRLQLAYNEKHGITPQTISKNIKDITATLENEREKTLRRLITLDKEAYGDNLKKLIKEKEKQMNAAVKELDFETAALLRDEIKELTKI